jgi:protein-tyrosine phosphatase
MRNWLMEPTRHEGARVVVVHCKAGKGRSGTIATSYLISQEGWKAKDALARFTERRMRPGFGPGVSIPSQLRWIDYVDYWSKHQKQYLERPVEIVEVHVWGLREGVKVCVQGYVEEGKKIKTFHTFTPDERLIIDPTAPTEHYFASKLGFGNPVASPIGVSGTKTADMIEPVARASSPSLINSRKIPDQPEKSDRKGSEPGGKAVIFRPKSTIIVSSSDVCIDFERRNKAPYGWTLVTAVSHAWFNVYFEGHMHGNADPSASSDLEVDTDRGVFEMEWDAMDGIKGSSRKGVRALDKVAIVWRAIGDESDGQAKIVEVPKIGEPVPEAAPAHWAGVDAAEQDDNPEKDVGMRVETPASANISKASSIRSNVSEREEKDKIGAKDGSSDYEDSLKGVKTHGMKAEEDPSGVS